MTNHLRKVYSIVTEQGVPACKSCSSSFVFIRILNEAFVTGRMILYETIPVLENGMTFAGEAFGASSDVIAEIVLPQCRIRGNVDGFELYRASGSTNLPPYWKLRRYAEDAESEKISVSAYIVEEYCLTRPTFEAGDLDSYLKRHGIPGIGASIPVR